MEYQTQSNIQIECRISNIKLNPTFKSNVEYRISNSISHSNFECRISNIKIIQHSNLMSNIEYETQSNIQIECRVSNIKLNPTFKSYAEYRKSNLIQHSNRMSNIEYQTQSHIQILNVEYRISN